jgi:hypothetical protein
MLPRLLIHASMLISFGLPLHVAIANPEPDVPVCCYLDSDGSARIVVEIDPRCFTADPMHERYLMKVDLEHRNAQDLQQIKAQAAIALQQWLTFSSEPQSALQPSFVLSFTGEHQRKLVKADDPVVVTAYWRFQRSAEMTAWRVSAKTGAPYSVVVSSVLDGLAQKRTATLFPGEDFSIALPTTRKK